MNRNALIGFLVVTVLLASTAPVGGASPDAEFAFDVAEVTAGETADITVELSNTDAAVVKIGSEAVNYVALVTVHDGNGDGTVTLRYDTSKAGRSGGFSAAADADDATVERESELEGRLAVGAYPLSAAPGSDVSSANETDVATLTVTEPETETTTETTTTSRYAGHVDDVEGGVVVAPARNQTITGTLDVAPGTEVLVEARKGGAFLKTQHVTVTDDGRFRASFDFSDVSTGSEFQILVRVDGERKKDVTGVVRVDGVVQTTTETTPEATETSDTTRETTIDTTTTTEQAVQDQTTGEGTRTEESDVPGFGLVTGVLALTAAVLLTRRRT